MFELYSRIPFTSYFRSNEMEAATLASIHNLHFIVNHFLVKMIRQTINLLMTPLPNLKKNTFPCKIFSVEVAFRQLQFQSNQLSTNFTIKYENSSRFDEGEKLPIEKYQVQ